jgi:hypothetical protein
MCAFPEGSGHSFPDGLPDYPRLLAMWYQAVVYTSNKTFEAHTLPRVTAMTNYMLQLHLNSTASLPPTSPVYGLIFGPAEHDTCRDQAYYISTQVCDGREGERFSPHLNCVLPLTRLGS